jgi:hypothetical protein
MVYNQGQESISQGEHISPEKTGDNIEAKRVALYGWDYTNLAWVRVSVDENGILQTSGSGGSGASVYNTAVYDTGTYS